MMAETPEGRKFPAGNTRATQAAMQAMQQAGHIASEFLARHVQGDWGDHDDEQKSQNDQNLADGGALHSIYHLSDGQEIWVFTEADRSQTTILLPSDSEG